MKNKLKEEDNAFSFFFFNFFLFFIFYFFFVGGGGSDYKLVTTLEGHAGKIMCADMRPDEKMLATVSYDRTWRVWVPE